MWTTDALTNAGGWDLLFTLLAPIIVLLIGRN